MLSMNLALEALDFLDRIQLHLFPILYKTNGLFYFYEDGTNFCIEKLTIPFIFTTLLLFFFHTIKSHIFLILQTDFCKRGYDFKNIHAFIFILCHRRRDCDCFSKLSLGIVCFQWTSMTLLTLSAIVFLPYYEALQML